MIPQFSLHPNDYTSSFVLAAVPLVSLPILLQWNNKTDILHMKTMVTGLRVPMDPVSGLCPLLFYIRLLQEHLLTVVQYLLFLEVCSPLLLTSSFLS